jgi:hypothetical protein
MPSNRCDKFIDLKLCRNNPFPTTLPGLYSLLTPDARKVVDCLNQLVRASADAAAQGQLEGLILGSQQVHTLASWGPAAVAAPAPGPGPNPNPYPYPHVPPLQKVEQCIKNKLAALGHAPTEKDFENAVIDCLETICPGVKAMSKCLTCVIGSALPHLGSNDNQLTDAAMIRAVLEHCTNCRSTGNWWDRLPEWARVLLIILIVLLALGALAAAYRFWASRQQK